MHKIHDKTPKLLIRMQRNVPEQTALAYLHFIPQKSLSSISYVSFQLTRSRFQFCKNQWTFVVLGWEWTTQYNAEDPSTASQVFVPRNAVYDCEEDGTVGGTVLFVDFSLKAYTVAYCFSHLQGRCQIHVTRYQLPPTPTSMV